MKKLNRWDQTPYRRIQQAWCEGDTLVVQFADESEARVSVSEVLPPGFTNLRWHELTTTPQHLVVPTPDSPDGGLEIPWDVIRRATDPEYAAHWEALTVAYYRRQGQQLQELRLSRNLSVAELADRMGRPAADLERIEQGDPELVYAHSDDLLEAMGLSHDALYTPPVKPRKRKTIA